MGIKARTTVSFAQRRGPLSGPRPVHGYADLYRLAAVSLEPGAAVPWDYRGLTDDRLATDVVLESSADGPSRFEVACEGRVLAAYRHPQYDQVIVRIDAESDGDELSLDVDPAVADGDPIAGAVRIERTDTLDARRFHAAIAIDLPGLRATLGDRAFGTAEAPSALVAAFTIRETHAARTPLTIAHAVSIQLRPMTQPPCSARTTVEYACGEPVGQLVLAASEGDGVDMRQVELPLTSKNGGFVFGALPYDTVAVRMAAHSRRVLSGNAADDAFQIAGGSSSPALRVHRTVHKPVPIVERDAFERPYVAEGTASATLRFAPQESPLDHAAVLGLAALFGHFDGRVTVLQHDVVVRRRRAREQALPIPTAMLA